MMLNKEKLFPIHFTSYYSIPGRVTIMRVSDPIWISYPPELHGFSIRNVEDLGGGVVVTLRLPAKCTSMAEEKNCQHTHTQHSSVVIIVLIHLHG